MEELMDNFIKEREEDTDDEDLSCDIFNDLDKLKERLRALEDSEDEDTDKDTEMTPEELKIYFWDNMDKMWGYSTEMTPEELQKYFWDNMSKMWGYDIIGSESHPLKKAFELYCEMKKEKEDEDK
jgi:hypothetical protein